MMKFSSSQARDQVVITPRENAGLTIEMTLAMPPRMAELRSPAHVKA
jgi:hypothetical protein